MLDDIAADERFTTRRRRWVDALLVGTGASLVAASAMFGIGLLVLAIPVLLLGLVMPLVRWLGRDRGLAGALALVPPELADSHRAVRAAASLPGVVDAARVNRTADDSLLEVAALLGGRPPRGAAQRRFVAARVAAMADTAADLQQRHEVWVAACDEVEALVPDTPLQEPSETRSGPLVAVLVVLLFPLFLGWDLLRAMACGLVALGDGSALRLRTTGRLVAQLGSGAIGLLKRARAAWTGACDEVVAAVREAHHRVSSARLRVRLRVRRARRGLPGVPLG
jgi:hypothetical protein